MKFTNAALGNMLLLVSGGSIQLVAAQAAQVALGEYHSCATDNTKNNLLCWGQNYFGELGDGTNEDKLVPTIISLGDDDADATHATQIALGGMHSCAIYSDNSLKCWGDNSWGSVGDGTWVNKNTPTIISLLGNNDEDVTYATQISLGEAHTCAIDNLNNLLCWGANFFGALGDGTMRTKNTPTTISLQDDDATYAVQIALGNLHSCALDNLNNVLCWGYNRDGELGDGTTDYYKTTPTIISLGDETDATYATLIASGAFHSCAMLNNNNLKCWGMNYSGELGDGTTESKNTPTTISLGDDDTTYATQIALGFGHSCAIDNLNKLKCWGGYYGNTTKAIISLDDKNVTHATKIALGSGHFCAIDNLDNLLCWGSNEYGQIGDGTRGDHETFKTTPTVISLAQSALLDGSGTIEEEEMKKTFLRKAVQ